MKIDLSSQVAIVTGGGGAIGRATAITLAGAGCAVLVADVDQPGAAAVADEVRELGGKADPFTLDISDEPEWQAAVAHAVESFGPVTILHNNAAHKTPDVMRADGNALEIELELWDRIYSVNLRGALLGCRAVLPAMLERGAGSIVMTSSAAGTGGSTQRVGYSTSKAALNALVRSIATSFGKRGIRCNAVAPGVVRTATNAAIISGEHGSALERAHLTPRLGEPQDVANAVAFLASDAAAFITGQTIAVDGGLTAHIPALSS